MNLYKSYAPLQLNILKAVAGELFRAFNFMCKCRPTETKLPLLSSLLMQRTPKSKATIDLPNSTCSIYNKRPTQSFKDQGELSVSNPITTTISKSRINYFNVNKLATDNFLLKRFYSSKADKKDQGGNKIVGQLHFNMTDYNIVHNKKEHYFYIILQEGSSGQKEQLAKLEYVWVKPGLADLFHTEVPPEFQGRGIAKQLVLAGLNALCEENIFIRPTCPYVQKVLRENPVQQHMSHIEKGFKL